MRYYKNTAALDNNNGLTYLYNKYFDSIITKTIQCGRLKKLNTIIIDNGDKLKRDILFYLYLIEKATRNLYMALKISYIIYDYTTL